MIDHRMDDPEDMRDFGVEDYGYRPDHSDGDHLVFTRVVVVWESMGSAGSDQSGASVQGQLFSAWSSRLGESFSSTHTRP